MDFPITAFDLRGTNNEFISIEILEIFGFPNETSFRGGYDIRCRLKIKSGIYSLKTDNYFSSTAALINFYNDINKIFQLLDGKCSYNVYLPENDLSFTVSFNKQGHVSVSGRYRDDLSKNNILNFEFKSDQSYFTQVILDLNNIYKLFEVKQ